MRAISNEDFELMSCPHPIVEELYSQRTLSLSGDRSVPMHVYIPREEGDYLYSLVRFLKPNHTIEIGMANGLSTLFIAQALRDNGHGAHTAIDPYQSTDWQNAGVSLLEKASLKSLVEVIEKPSHQALPQLEGANVECEFIFVDGSHLFDYVMTDFLCGDRLLKVGGFMAFDDSDWPAVSQVIRFILANRHYRVAFVDVVIEDPCYRPSVAGRGLRRLAHWVPRLRDKLAPSFLTPNFECGVRGRCVVLEKLALDDRDSQSNCHNAF